MPKKIKIIYLILFLLLLFHPHFITGHVFSLPHAYAQSLINVIIIGLGYLVYWLHHKDIRHKEKEKKVVEEQLELSNGKLMDSYKHIGLVNRRLPLLKNLTTDLLKRRIHNHRHKKDIFDELLRTAVASVAKTDWGILRFIDLTSENTVKEFIYNKKEFVPHKIKISNKDLLAKSRQNGKIKHNEKLYMISCSDEESAVKCFLIFSKQKEPADDEYSILQSIVDQTQLFYQYLFNNK